MFISPEAVRQNPLTAKASDAEIEHHQIKQWLKFAKERDGHRKQRDGSKRAANSTS